MYRQANAFYAVPAFVLGIIVGPVAANLINVADWDHDGVYHEIHEIAYVCPPRLSLSPSRMLTTTCTTESNTHRHRNPTNQSRLRTSETIPETARGRNDNLPFTGHDDHVALHNWVYHARRAQDFMGMLSTFQQKRE